MHVGVVGAGYVGLVTGVSLALIGDHSVTFIERSDERRRILAAGGMPISEPQLAESYERVLDRVTVTDDFGGLRDADVVMVCVGTPTDERGEPDLTQVREVARGLRGLPDLHISVRSTLPPGYSMRLPEVLGRADGSRISTNPEFLRQGSAMRDFANPSRIVFGLFPETSHDHVRVLESVFAPFPGPRLTVSVAAAELIKNVANGFLALKLSFVNEIASLAEEYEVDVDDVLHGIELDPRIGSSYMKPSLGFGGSCLPKELDVLATAGRRQGLSMHVARAAAQVNGEQQDRFVRAILAELQPQSQVGLLGLSFKAGTDDLRGSPAVYLARRLTDAGHRVLAFDPAVQEADASAAIPDIEMQASAIDVFRGSHAIAIATDWPEFASIDLAHGRRLVATPLLFDGRNLFDPEHVDACGFRYRGIGRRRGASKRGLP